MTEGEGVSSSQQFLENRMTNMMSSGVDKSGEGRTTTAPKNVHNVSVATNDDGKNSDETSNDDSSSEEEDEEEQPTVMEEIKATWALLVDPRMRRFIPLCSWTALSLAIYQSSFGPLLALGMGDKGWDDD